MSISQGWPKPLERLEWAIEASITGPAKAILLVIAYRAKDAECWFPMPQLAKEAGVSVRTAQVALNELIAAKLVHRHRRYHKPSYLIPLSQSAICVSCLESQSASAAPLNRHLLHPPSTTPTNHPSPPPTPAQEEYLKDVYGSVPENITTRAQASAVLSKHERNKIDGKKSRRDIIRPSEERSEADYVSLPR